MMRAVRANVPQWLVAINITESWTYTAHQHTRLSVNVQVEPLFPGALHTCAWVGGRGRRGFEHWQQRVSESMWKRAGAVGCLAFSHPTLRRDAQPCLQRTHDRHRLATLFRTKSCLLGVRV